MLTCDPHHSVKSFLIDNAGPCCGESFEVLVRANFAKSIDCKDIFQSACREFFSDDRCD